MKKFELKVVTMEFRMSEKEEIKPGCTIGADSCDPETIKTFYTKEEAFEELKKYKSTCRKVEGNVFPVYCVKEFYLEEQEYEEDNEDYIEIYDVWPAEFEKLQ